MENSARSERTRNIIIQATIAILARDGMGKLTLDAIAREGGISKGGLMHQFRTKEAVLKAMLEHQIDNLDKFSTRYIAEAGPDHPEAVLASEIARARHSVTGMRPEAASIFVLIGNEPELLSMFKEIDARKCESIRAEAADPDLALLRWMAARGMIMSAAFGVSALSAADHERLFDRLLDSKQWPPASQTPRRKPKSAPETKPAKPAARAAKPAIAKAAAISTETVQPSAAKTTARKTPRAR